MDDSERKFTPTRRTVLKQAGAAAGAGMLGGSLSTGAVGTQFQEQSQNLQSSYQAETGDVPTPTIEGPLGDVGAQTGGPQFAAVQDLEAYGYTETEFIISGSARADPTAEEPETAEYATRMVVYQPADPEEFNGRAVVEWPNVSTQIDVPAVWINSYDYLLREGYAVVLISAQKVGVDGSSEDLDLVSWDTERYGDLVHPGDEYAHDIFSQGTKLLQAEELETDPLDGLQVEQTLATGLSQSSHFLLSYINNVQAHHDLFDGFMPVTTSQTPREEDDIRDDLIPVLWVMSEDEADEHRRPDGGLFRLWEVAGASHVNHWLSGWADVASARDIAGQEMPWDPDSVGQFGQLADGNYDECEYNYFPMRYAYNAAFDQLSEWVETDDAPESAPRIERDDGVVTDEFGNAEGGVRLPVLDAPVARYDARREECELYGATERFEAEQLEALYEDRRTYLGELGAAAEEAIEAGYLLEADARDLLDRAKTIDDLEAGVVPTPTVEELTGGEQTGEPQTAAVHDIEPYGYVEEEYAFMGEAQVQTEVPVLFEDDAPEPTPVGPASYATRMLVYRPEDPDAFNGEVVVDWMNVTNQRDAPVAWINSYDHLLREGYAVALVSVQKVGVQDSDTDRDLVTWDPERYGDLDHPGDAYAFDIFSQAAQALRGTPETDPLDGLDPEIVIGTGMSQSAFFLQPYIADVQPEHGVYDGFMPTTINVYNPAVTETETPVLWINTEDEATGQMLGPFPDTESYRLWEVAGASHVNFWLSAWSDLAEHRDFGDEPDWFAADSPEWDPAYAGQYGQVADAIYGICGTNYFPVRYAYRAGFARLSEWIRTGDPPESVDRLDREDGEVQTDEFENATGGLRLPPIEEPVASYFAQDEVCGNGDPLESLLGATERLSDDQLEARYGTVDGYLDALETAADGAVESGVMLEADRDELLQQAQAVDGLPAESGQVDDLDQSPDDTDEETDDGAPTDGEDDTADADDDGPGFGAPAAISGAGGLAYLLSQRLGSDSDDKEE